MDKHTDRDSKRDRRQSSRDRGTQSTQFLIKIHHTAQGKQALSLEIMLTNTLLFSALLFKLVNVDGKELDSRRKDKHSRRSTSRGKNTLLLQGFLCLVAFDSLTMEITNMFIDKRSRSRSKDSRRRKRNYDYRRENTRRRNQSRSYSRSSRSKSPESDKRK